MAKQVRQVKMPKDVKKETDMKENIGKVLVNFGQILFATLFLGGVLRGAIPPYIMILSGALSALLFVILGLLLTAKEKKE